jgi:muramoyltetrapeptide carboxypeptidase
MESAMVFKQGDKIGIVGCSNALLLSFQPKMDILLTTIKEMGLTPVLSNCIFEKFSIYSGSALERANELHRFYEDTMIKAIFDISGGDIANEALEHLDFNLIKNNPKPFFGYSDLTTIINAIYTKTEVSSYLYQIRNLIYKEKELQKKWFINSLLYGEKDLFDIKYSFIQGNRMEGIIVGGNIRCFLKLAGTPFLPDFKDKILLLESHGGEVALITTYLNQLKQMGVFSQINGIILGTFTKMEENFIKPTVPEILLDVVNNIKLPVVVTREIGHGTNAKCIEIGSFLTLSKN